MSALVAGPPAAIASSRPVLCPTESISDSEAEFNVASNLSANAFAFP